MDIEMGLKGKVAIVTGGSRGIGKASALELAREGVKVAMCARGLPALQEAASEIQRETGTEVLPVRADVTVYDDIKNLVKTTADRFGKIDILVNSAVNFPVGTDHMLSEEAWANHINVKVMAYIRSMREVIPHMVKQGTGGRIVNIAGLGVRQAIGTEATSGATSAAVVNITKAVADAHAKDNILVNAIHPGPTRTQRHQMNMNYRSQTEKISLQEAERRTVATIPIGRIIEPEEVAYLVVFLCSSMARTVTGQTIAVDGGTARGVFY